MNEEWKDAIFKTLVVTHENGKTLVEMKAEMRAQREILSEVRHHMKSLDLIAQNTQAMPAIAKSLHDGASSSTKLLNRFMTLAERFVMITAVTVVVVLVIWTRSEFSAKGHGAEVNINSRTHAQTN